MRSMLSVCIIGIVLSGCADGSIGSATKGPGSGPNAYELSPCARKVASTGSEKGKDAPCTPVRQKWMVDA